VLPLQAAARRTASVVVFGCILLDYGVGVEKVDSGGGGGVLAFCFFLFFFHRQRSRGKNETRHILVRVKYLVDLDDFDFRCYLSVNNC